MKYLLSTLLLLFSFTILSAQKEGNIWILGYSGGASCYKVGLDFNSGVLDTFSVCGPMSFFLTNSSICDSIGDLLFYTNGYSIANGNQQLIDGSSGFNPSITNPSQNYLNISQGTLILPKPNSLGKYYIFHVNGEFIINNTEFQPLELRYSIIDMQLDSGKGAVDSTSFNVGFYQDTVNLGRLTATKHANGKDWWLVSHTYHSDEYLVFKVTSDSIIGPTKQSIGSLISQDVLGKACFSPNGNYFAQTGWNYFIDLMKFDRCTGTFSDWTRIEIHDTTNVSPDTLLLLSCEFSPSGQFLYVTNNLNVFQFDITADTIEKSKKIIGTWNGLLSPQPTWFFQMQCASDNKIYINTYGGTDRLHVINNPDLSDTLSNLEQGLIMPSFDSWALPNLINYDLDSLSYNYCDSVILVNVQNNNSKRNSTLLAYPNPSTDIVTFKLIDSQLLIETVQIFSSTGKLVDNFNSINSNQYLYDRALPSGLYYYCILTQDYNFYSGKIIFE